MLYCALMEELYCELLPNAISRTVWNASEEAFLPESLSCVSDFIS